MKLFNRSLLLLLVALVGQNAFASTSPSEVNIKIYEFWVGQNADCTNMTRVYSESNPSYQNMVVGPTFGQMNVPNGTYNCVAWKMSDLLQYTPIANDGNDCVASTQYQRDLFRSDFPQTSVCPDGTTINSSGTNASLATQVEDTMCIYISVNGSSSNSAFTPSQAFPLTAPFVVNGTSVGTMVVDFTNKILDSGSECDCEPPVFGFR